MEERFCYIFGAAECGGTLKFTPERGKDFVIAADAGYRHLEALGIAPDLLIGDFDSLSEIPDGVARLQFPAMKDDTDLMLAVKHGFTQGYRQFVIYGAMGGRLDFTLANFQILCSIVNHGGNAYFVGGGSLITAVRDGTLQFDEHFTGRISILCCTDQACGVTLRGLKYPLEQAVLKYDEPLGVSNEFLGRKGTITVENGLLAILYDDVNNMMKNVKNKEVRR